jgi:hypothetical protein
MINFKMRVWLAAAAALFLVSSFEYLSTHPSIVQPLFAMFETPFSGVGTWLSPLLHKPI